MVNHVLNGIPGNRNPRISHVNGQPINIVVVAIQQKVAARGGSADQGQSRRYHRSLRFLHHPRIRHQRKGIRGQSCHTVRDGDQPGIHTFKVVHVKWIITDPRGHGVAIEAPDLHRSGCD